MKDCVWCHNTQHNDTQQNETHYNNTQHNDTQQNETHYNNIQHNDTQNTRNSVLINCHYAECNYEECRVLFIMLSVIMLHVVIRNGIILTVVAPCLHEPRIIFCEKNPKILMKFFSFPYFSWKERKKLILWSGKWKPLVGLIKLFFFVADGVVK